MSASRIWAASIFTATMLIASPTLAVINIASDEIWDGHLNPHEADGVTLTITGDYATNNRVATYNIPTGVTIGAGANIFLHDLANPQFSSTINFNFAPGAGALTFTDANSTIDVTKGGRNNPGKNFTINMNDNSILQATPGAGRIINGVYVLANQTGDPFSVVINGAGSANVAIGTIDVRKNDAQGSSIVLQTRGAIDLDNLLTSDVSSGGGSGGAVTAIGTNLTIGNVDTRTFRTGGGGSMGNITLRALGQPSNDPGNFNANTFAANKILLDGVINTNGPQAGLTGGTIVSTGVQTTLASTFQWDKYPGSTWTANTGADTPGFTQAQLFINNSASAPTTVNYNVFHDGQGPAAVTWTNNSSGNFATATNWTPNAAPQSNNTVATFGSVITSPQTIYLNSAGLAKGLVFDTTSKVAVAGTSPLTLESNAGNATLTVNQGSHEIQTQLTTNTNTTATLAAGTTLDLNGVLNLNSKTLNITGAGTLNINNTVTGLGSISSGATLGTGGATGLAGDLTSTGTLAIDIAGAVANSYDSWNVTGAATLSGILSVDAIAGFTPTAGQSFTILTANSVNAAGLTLGGPDAGLFSLVKNPTSLVLQVGAAAGVLGDYNGNGIVDGADYVLWRNGGPLLNQGDNPAVVNQADYTFWRSRFGATSGSGLGSGAAVPEPASAVLFLLAGLALVARKGREC